MSDRRSQSPIRHNAVASGSGSGSATEQTLNAGMTRRRSASPPTPPPAKSPRQETQHTPGSMRSPAQNRAVESPSWTPTSPRLPLRHDDHLPSTHSELEQEDSRPRQRQRLDESSTNQSPSESNAPLLPGLGHLSSSFIFRIPTRRSGLDTAATEIGLGAEGTSSQPNESPDSEPGYITWTFQVGGGPGDGPPQIPSIGILPARPHDSTRPNASQDPTTDPARPTGPMSEPTFLPFPPAPAGMRMGPFGPVSIPPAELAARPRQMFPEVVPPFFGGLPTLGRVWNGGQGQRSGSGPGSGAWHDQVVFFGPGYTFIPVNIPNTNGPAQAAELLKALESVSRETMDDIDQKIRSEESGQKQDVLGWKCGICLQGLEDEEEDGDEIKPAMADPRAEMRTKREDPGVKKTPCSHLFHGVCLQPWFERHLNCPLCRKSLDSLLSTTTESADGLD